MNKTNTTPENTIASNALNELRDCLRSRSPGPIESLGEVFGLLMAAWDGLDGSRDTSMAWQKLGRMESIEWQPPILSFTIERHGAAMCGSMYAELQDWAVDVDAGTVGCSSDRKRLIGERDAPLDVHPLAKRIAVHIAKQEVHEWLKWRNDDRTLVTVRIGDVIPHTNNQTTSARRRRFRKQLETELRVLGWTPARGCAPNTYCSGDAHASP